MKTRIRKQRHIRLVQTMRLWLKKEVVMSRPVLFLLYVNVYIASNYLWSANPLLNKLFVFAYLLATFFLIVYAHTLIPETPEEET